MATIVPSSGQVPPPALGAEDKGALSELTSWVDGGQAHAECLAYMRWRRDEAVSSDASLAPSVEMGSDLRLHRFLVSTQWDSQAAADAYVQALRWRRDRCMDAVRDRVVAANPSFFQNGADHLDTLYVGEDDAAVQAVQPRTFTREVDGGKHALLFDKIGNLVIVECPGLVDNQGIMALGAAKWTASFFGSNELTVLLLDELSRRQGRIILTCKIMDMTGMKLVNPFASKEEKEGERAAKDAGSQVSAAYPTTTFKMILLNLPGASMAGPIVKAIAPARSAKKFIFAKSNDELKTFVDAASLPRKLGGELPDGLQWVAKKKK